MGAMMIILLVSHKAEHEGQGLMVELIPADRVGLEGAVAEGDDHIASGDVVGDALSGSWKGDLFVDEMDGVDLDRDFVEDAKAFDGRLVSVREQEPAPLGQLLFAGVVTAERLGHLKYVGKPEGVWHRGTVKGEPQTDAGRHNLRDRGKAFAQVVLIKFSQVLRIRLKGIAVDARVVSFWNVGSGRGQGHVGLFYPLPDPIRSKGAAQLDKGSVGRRTQAKLIPVVAGLIVRDESVGEGGDAVELIQIRNRIVLHGVLLVVDENLGPVEQS